MQERSGGAPRSAYDAYAICEVTYHGCLQCALLQNFPSSPIYEKKLLSACKWKAY